MGAVRDTLKLMLGRLAEVALPELGREIDEVRNPARAPRLKRAILYARLRRAHARGDAAGMETALAAFWKGGPGDSFHGSHNAERLRVFREQHAEAIEVLAALPGFADRFDRLVEIGCGDGKVLADCIAGLPSITRAIGLDINASAIAQAAADHADPRLAFVHADALDWLAANSRPGTVLLSNGGVLEYVTPQNVDRLYQALALAPPAAVVLVEPAAPDHDLAARRDSYVFGREFSFSHNHRHRLARAGLKVVFERETQAFGARLVVWIGVRD